MAHKRRRNADRRNPLTTTGPDTTVYSVSNYTEEYTVNRDDSESTKAEPWVVRYNGQTIGTASMRRLAFGIADLHQNKVTEAHNKKAEEEREAYARSRADLAKEPGMTVEQLLEEPQGGGVAIVSGEYAEDEAALISSGPFQAIALEPPVGYVLPATVDRHGFTMMLNRTTQERGIQYSFIGTPRKAMREIRRLAWISGNSTSAEEVIEAQKALGWHRTPEQIADYEARHGA